VDIPASATCSAGSCVLTTCSVNHANCDANNVNGCETDLSTDSGNCGACSVVCIPGNTCVPGV
jgi:hypothetical protein